MGGRLGSQYPISVEIFQGKNFNSVLDILHWDISHRCSIQFDSINRYLGVTKYSSQMSFRPHFFLDTTIILSTDHVRNIFHTGVYLIWVVLLLFGSLPGLLAGYSMQQTRASRSWTPVVAVVDSVRLVTKKSAERPRARTSVVTHYHYFYRGTTYPSDRIAFGYYGTWGMERNGTLYNKLRTARRVRAYVNPQKPEEATLCREYHNSQWFGIALSILFCSLISLGMIGRIHRGWVYLLIPVCGVGAVGSLLFWIVGLKFYVHQYIEVLG